MRVCFICNEYAPAPHGGIGSFTQDVAESLSAGGHSVTVAGLYAAGDSHQEPEVDRHGVCIHRWPRSTWRRPWQVQLIQDHLRLARHVRALHRETPFDLIECPDYDGWLALTRLSGVPLLARVHGTNLLFDRELGRPGLSLEYWFEKRWLRTAHAWVAVSEYAARRTVALCGGTRPIRVLYNAVDADRFAPDDTPVENGLIVFANSIGPRKGVPQLLAAMELVVRACPQARLLLIGGDAEKSVAGAPYSQHLADGLPPAVRERVVFAGPLDRITGVLPALRRAHLCCYPSLCETFGLAPVEAMALGKPVVYTRLGPGPEVIEDGVSGLLCDPRSPADIADRICTVLKDPGLGTRLGQAARRRVVERFDRKTLLLRNIEFYEECIARHGGRVKIK